MSNVCFSKVYDLQDEETSYEKIQQLPYLDLVLKEGWFQGEISSFFN